MPRGEVMGSEVKLGYAIFEGLISHISDFDYLRDRDYRPKGLTCPECEQAVVARLSRESKIRDHFAHHGESNCPLSVSESALHFNAKMTLSQKLSQFHKASLAFNCKLCRNWYSYLEINDYDEVMPELKMGRRKPDITCLQSKQPIGAAEVWNTNAVSVDKKRDLRESGIPWFEIPAAKVHPQYFQHIFGADVISFDAHAVGVTYPPPPFVCEVCDTRRKTEAKGIKEQERFNADLARVLASIPIQERWNLTTEQKTKAVERMREEEAAREINRLRLEESGGAAYLSSRGDLIIPIRSQFKYRYWSGGQSVFATLAELNASSEIWLKYGQFNQDLLSGGHSNRCKGDIYIGGDILYCVECGHFAVSPLR